MVNKVVVIDFTDNTQKAYTGVPATILDDKEKAGKLVKARAKRDYRDKEIQTWSIEDGQTYLAPEIDNEIASAVDFPLTFKLTENGKYVLKDLVKSTLKAQRGLTVQQIVQNIRNLTLNCIDPIKKKYPKMVVTSCFRITGEIGKESEYTDHGLGAAVDMGFPGDSGEKYVEIATWIKKNIPHKQLLLEYREAVDPQTKIPFVKKWIHVSFIQINGQVVKSELPVATFWNDKTAGGGAGVFLALA